VALSTAGPVIFVDGELCNPTSKTAQLKTIPNKNKQPLFKVEFQLKTTKGTYSSWL